MPKFFSILFVALSLSTMVRADQIGNLINNQEQIQCLARNIYHEARGESKEGQRAVAHVTLNRVESKRFPNTVCKVVYQRRQFSWTNSGKKRVKNAKAYEIAEQIATEILLDENRADNTGGALFYHASWMKKYPRWSRKLTRTTKIGVHIFYK